MRITTEEYVAMKNNMSVKEFRKYFKLQKKLYPYYVLIEEFKISRGTVAKLVKLYREKK